MCNQQKRSIAGKDHNEDSIAGDAPLGVHDAVASRPKGWVGEIQTLCEDSSHLLK